MQARIEDFSSLRRFAALRQLKCFYRASPAIKNTPRCFEGCKILGKGGVDLQVFLFFVAREEELRRDDGQLDRAVIEQGYHGLAVLEEGEHLL